MTKRIELAYCAGLVDGEAWLGIKKTKAYACQDRVTPGYHAKIQVRMVDREGLELMSQIFGGRFRHEPAHCKGRPIWCWAVSNLAAEKAIIALLPFLRVKRQQAEITLELRALQRDRYKHKTKITGYRNWPNGAGTPRTIATTCLSDEYVSMCEQLYVKCRKLNGLARFQ